MGTSDLVPSGNDNDDNDDHLGEIVPMLGSDRLDFLTQFFVFALSLSFLFQVK